MKNHLNILPKLASFDLKCSKMRWRLGLRPRPRCGSLRRSPRPPSREGLRTFGARNSLFLSSLGPYILLPQIYPLPQFNIPRIANGSKQPPDPTPSALWASFPDRRNLNCMGPLTYFPVIRPLMILYNNHIIINNIQLFLVRPSLCLTHPMQLYYDSAFHIHYTIGSFGRDSASFYSSENNKQTEKQ